MSFGLDGSFSAGQDSEQEDRALKAMALLVLVPTLFPFVVVGALSALTELGVLSPSDQGVEQNTTIVAEASTKIPSSKYAQIDLNNPVVTVDKCQNVDGSTTPIIKSVPCKFKL